MWEMDVKVADIPRFFSSNNTSSKLLVGKSMQIFLWFLNERVAALLLAKNKSSM